MATGINYWALLNGTDLSKAVPGLQIYNINPYVLPVRVVNRFPLARRSASKSSSAFFTAREISISVWIIQPSRALLDKALDTLYSLLPGLEVPLIIPQSNTTRQYTVTFDSHVHNNAKSGASTQPAPAGGFIDLTLNFMCSDSYGYDTTYTLIANQNITTSNATVAYTQGGGVDTQVPFLQAQITSLTGGGGGTSIILGNQATGQAITVTRNWLAHDIIQVDSRNRTVQVNGVDTAFTGAFPEFAPGLANPYYTDTFTTRTTAIYFYVYNRWY